MSFRRGEATPKGGFFGLGVLVVIVAVFIGGSAFAGQKLYDSQLEKSQSAKAPATDSHNSEGSKPAAPSSPFANSLGATTNPAPAAADPTPPSVPPALASAIPALVQPASVVAASEAAKLKRKAQAQQVHRVRPAGAGAAGVGAAPPPSDGLPSERGAVSQPASTPPNWL
jgi:hypothetical protein